MCVCVCVCVHIHTHTHTHTHTYIYIYIYIYICIYIYIMPYNSRADECWLMAERYDSKSNAKLGGFQSQLEASYVSSHTEELWYKETVCLWMTISAPQPGVEHSSEGINSCYWHNAKLFVWVDHSGIRLSKV